MTSYRFSEVGTDRRRSGFFNWRCPRNAVFTLFLVRGTFWRSLMGITQWLAVAMIFVVIYGLIKRYETRLVLIGSGPRALPSLRWTGLGRAV